MPRISAEQRESNRAVIIAAARRCFSRDGFHQTSMPDISAEARVSTGAPYRYFASKEEIILEIAGDAFKLIFNPVIALIEGTNAVTIGDLVATAINPVGRSVAVDSDGNQAPVEELLRCAVQAWGELLRHEGLRHGAQAGFDHVRGRITQALLRGQDAGTVPAEVNADNSSRVVMALLQGFVLQRVAFGLHDIERITQDVRSIITDAGILHATGQERSAGVRG